MKDITIIIPVLNKQLFSNELSVAINNIVDCQKNYKEGKLSVLIVRQVNESIDEKNYNDIDVKYVYNDGKTDYCSQINCGIKQVNTEYFSIMEFDDRYNTKWFNMFNEYLNTHEDVSVFLPIEVVHNVKTNEREFVNDIVWQISFSNEIGFIDFECLENSASFNLTGGIFKTSDWLGYKPSIKVSFNYEYLLRATDKNQTIYVVPKEGYYHDIFREDSLISQYSEEFTDEDIQKWFELAKREYAFDIDRNKGIIAATEDELK